jgi:hypothetical protein
MSTERLTKRRRLDARDLPNPDPKIDAYFPTIDNALAEANTCDAVQPKNTQPEKFPSVCQICSRPDLWPMFSQDTSEISAGRLSKYMKHSCPFADLVQMAMRLRCDSSWVSEMAVSQPEVSPDLLVKSRGWVFTRIPIPNKKNYKGNIILGVENHHPRIILAINQRPRLGRKPSIV